MLVVDSSAIAAVLFDEPEAPACMSALQGYRTRLLSAANYVEIGAVMAGRASSENRLRALADLDDYLNDFRIRIVPVDQHLARAALRARIAYGRGFGTRGGLNFGDSFAYALAKHHAAPLLYVGDDFCVTDTQSAL
ncbi:MAG: type II toxin-antitoxin system VapC family toxin [Oceanicaulis sp.]|nr:type II toxin-antitoxin system VapC family toxin [Oceanicaulis sp.]